MPDIDLQALHSCLAAVQDPHTGQPLDPDRQLRDQTLSGNTLALSLRLAYPARGYIPALEKKLAQALAPVHDGPLRVDVGWDIVSHSVQKGISPLPEVRNTIAIASGKGGVGKSTTAVNLALALQAEGARAGLLDADIYGPSQPRMLGSQGQPDSLDGKRVLPKQAHGLQSMSIGYLIEEDTPMIWRGPMATSALEQLLHDTQWQDLDYLIIDLPPGTGDVQLTLCQKIPVSGAIIVTTPQDIALTDAKKALKMFHKVQVPVLGIVENMSYYACSHCGHQEAIFGSGGGARMAEQYAVDLLGALPLDVEIRSGLDQGRPVVAEHPESALAELYRSLARNAAARLALRAKDYSGRFPKIVVEND